MHRRTGGRASPIVIGTELHAHVDRRGPISVHLHGPAGSGKSHLLSTLSTRGEVRRIVAHPEEAGTAYAGLHQLSAWLAPAVAELPGLQADALAAALALEAAATPDLPILAATHQALTILAEDGGATIVVDDIDCLDPATRAALAFTRRRLDHDDLRFVTASRRADTHLDADEIWTLDPLTEDETRQLLRGAHPELEHGVAAWVWQQSSGLPLAAVDICRELRPEQRTGAARLPDVAAAVPRLQELAEPRLRRLSAPGRLLLAGLTWERMTRDDCLRFLAATDHPDGAAVIDEAYGLALLAMVDRRLTVAHPTLTPAIRDLLDPFEHERVHRAILAVFGGQPSVSARHLLELARLGLDRTAPALEALGTAAQAAADAGAWAEAAAAWEQAAELAESIGRPDGLDWWARAGWAAVRANAGPICHRVLTRLDADGSAHHPDHAELWWTTHLYTVGPTAPIDLASGERLAHSLVDHPDRALSLVHTCALGAAQAGRFAEASDLLTRFGATTGLAPRSQRDQVLADAIHLVAGVPGAGTVLNGPWARQLSASDLVDPSGFFLPLTGLLAWAGDPTAAAAAVQRQHQEVEARSLIGSVPFVACNQATLARYRDDFVAADLLFVRVAEISAATGFGGVAPFAAARHAHLLAEAGDLARARSVLDATFPGPVEDLPPLHAYAAGIVRAMLEVGDGRPGPAFDHLTRALDTARTHGLRAPRLLDWAATAATILADLLDEDPRADVALLRERIDAELASGDVVVARSAPRCRALLASPADRDRAWADAARDAVPGPSPYEAARVLLARGQFLRRDRRRGEALEPLDAARQRFDDLGLAVWRAAAERELRACGRRFAPEEARGGALAALTPRELDVARELATTATNAEIAARLFVSRRTVEFHVGSIYRKLGVTDRAAVLQLLSGTRPTAAPPAVGSVRG